ncbi:MAG: peptidylprolyl isomerase [Woeseiaceae bacterium]|nr:peptidylprolyl isomerase [Woeseiaceae bacterium]
MRTVNGEPIDSSVLDFYIRSRTNRPPAQVATEQRESLLSELTDIYLLTTQDTAKELRDDPQVAAQIELQSRGVLAQAVASQFFANTEVSEEEIQAEYESQSKVAPPQQYKARHILVETQGKAADLISQLEAGGDFQALARSESTGPSSESGGDIGWFSPDQMVKPFSDAVVGLEDGAYTKAPVQTEFGWHVILREGSREAEPPPLDSVRDQITQAVQQRKFQAHLESLRESGNVEN